MTWQHFHPATRRWFERTFNAPSDVQQQAWPAFRARQHTLIAAPTGSGKTLAGFLAAIDQLVQEGMEHGLPDETRVLYVSPLKALSNDIHKNLELPLNGIRDSLLELGQADVPVRAMVRTGDTPQAVRAAMKRQPPHILVTTPESLYLLLTSESGREMLRPVRTVIVDEIHALAGNKRGAHLTLSLERLGKLTAQPPVRIGISATQKPIEDMARYLVGDREEPCTIIDTGHVRQRDLKIEVTGSPLEALMANEVWDEIYQRLEALIEEHRTTLIFVNTRRYAERIAAALAERLGEEAVTSHHGSLAREHRLEAEQRLKSGRLRALVATASLELGIDIGEVDLVCQLGSPHSIATFLQRVGRSGHALHAIPKGRLFPLSRDDLIECTALLDAVQKDELDRIPMPLHPLDVLSQQIVAEVSNCEWDETELYETFKRAWPYRELQREQFGRVCRMLAEGYHTRRGRRGAYLHRDAVHGKLRTRKGARLVALMNGGAIPDQFDYDVILQPEGLFIGTLNEDFAFESLPGDIFQLGNTSYRMLKIEQGKVFVEDAHGQPPNIPFWFGEAPGRTDELSIAVSRLRQTLNDLLEQGQQVALDYCLQQLQLPEVAAIQMVEYLAASKGALSVIPTRQQIVFERFFDETGDMHFVIHAPFGSRINRAWGLALRKRFCRKFNFELQAAANEDNIVLSLGPTHSFPLDEVARYLNAQTVKEVLVQALLAAPMFPTRWRWVANIALAVPRMRNGKRVPAPFQRNDAEDLIALTFPDQLACFENIAGDRQVPEHPLVEQTLWDCLHELMDIEGLIRLLQGIEQNTITITARDLSAPSPMAQEILNARPYAFLDDAPAEERRTLAIQQQRHLDPRDAAELGRLNPDTIQMVCEQAWPEAHTEDELHDALNLLGFLTEAEGERGPLSSLHERLAHGWPTLFEDLQKDQRATTLTTPGGQRLWVVAERLQELQLVLPESRIEPAIPAVDVDPELTAEQALINLLRSRLEGLGPVTATALAEAPGLTEQQIEQALLALQQEGFVIQGHFTGTNTDIEWCERGLLARMHRYTLKQKRSEIEPVPPASFMRFLFHWQRLDDPGEGEAALENTLQQLEGISLPAVAWENDILPARLMPYSKDDLDRLCNSGRFVWLRVNSGKEQRDTARKATTLKSVPVSFVNRMHLADWHQPPANPALSAGAQKVLHLLQRMGASFFDDLQHEAGMLPTQLEKVLAELIAGGLVTSDNFQGLRTQLAPLHKRHRHVRQQRHVSQLAAAGRWSLLRINPREDNRFERVEHVVRILLQRYGVIFRKLLERESGLPGWRDLLYILRRLEARGEIRGGRFVQGFAGEQFALPVAADQLKKIHKQPARGELIILSTADPLNLTGLITPGERIAAKASNRLIYQDGIPLASSQRDQVTFLSRVEANDEWRIRNLLLRRNVPQHYHSMPPGSV